MKKGFTLIELLVVVLIIGVLSAIALPQYQLAVTKTRVAILLPLMKSIDTAQKIYKMANGHYSEDFSELDIQMPGGAKTVTATQIKYDDWNCWLNERVSVYCNTSHINLEKYYQYDFTDCWSSAPSTEKICKSLCGTELETKPSGNKVCYF